MHHRWDKTGFQMGGGSHISYSKEALPRVLSSYTTMFSLSLVCRQKNRRMFSKDTIIFDRCLPTVWSTLPFCGNSQRLSPLLSVPACCLWMKISFSVVLQRKTLLKNEVKEDGRVAVSTPVGGTPH